MEYIALERIASCGKRKATKLDHNGFVGPTDCVVYTGSKLFPLRT